MSKNMPATSICPASRPPRLPLSKLNEFRIYVSGLSTPKKIQSWKKRWYHAPPDLRNYVREVFHYDKELYYQSYRPDHEDIEHILEEGMRAFSKLIKRMARKARQERLQYLYLVGQSMLQQFSADLIRENPISTPIFSDFVFVSIDFEGEPENEGINEVGFATLDSRDVLPSVRAELHIQDKNFAFKRFQRNRPFMFGQTIRANSCELSKIVSDELGSRSDQGTPRKILLVGHGIPNEIQIMDSLDLQIETLVTGVVDTHQLAETLGIRSASLHRLLTLRSVPHAMSSLHCGGNDAHYTLQLLLSLLCDAHTGSSNLEVPFGVARLRELSTRAGPPRARDKHPSCGDNSETDIGEVAFLAHDRDEDGVE